jgi:hypothetical protein
MSVSALTRDLDRRELDRLWTSVVREVGADMLATVRRRVAQRPLEDVLHVLVLASVARQRREGVVTAEQVLADLLEWRPPPDTLMAALKAMADKEIAGGMPTLRRKSDL